MERIRFDASDGVSLEGEVRLPDGPVIGPAVICHPHPQHGGSKDHPLLWAIRNDLAARGFLVVSFNFRGVMGSDGAYGGGLREMADVQAAIGIAITRAAGAAFVCGWSFGANAALRTAMPDERVGALALIGLPLGESSLDLPPLPDRAALKGYGTPVLLLAGEADPFCPVPDLRALGRRLGNATVEIVPRTDHFFWKRESEVAGIVGAFAGRSLPGRTG